MLLHRINPEENEYRFYLVEIQPSLFDPFTVARIWGRIGGAQRSWATVCATPWDAYLLYESLVRLRLKNGYKIVGGDCEQIQEEEAARPAANISEDGADPAPSRQRKKKSPRSQVEAEGLMRLL